MIWLLLTILSSTIIFILFKEISEKKLTLIYPIVLNYFIGAFFGIIVFGGEINQSITDQSWLMPSVLIGLLFIVNFFIIGTGTKVLGVTIASIAIKMSLIIPVIFSILVYNETVSTQKITGISLAIIALLLSTIKKQEKKGLLKRLYFIPLLFVGSGLVDTSVKYAQAEFLKTTDFAPFSGFVFLFAGLIGLLYLIISKHSLLLLFNKQNVKYGTMLGLANFSALFFFIKALTSNVFDTSIIFGVNNVSILLLTGLAGIIAYKERVTLLNKTGLLLAIISIVILTI